MDTWRERLHEDIPGACHVVHRYESGRLRKRSELTIAFSGERHFSQNRGEGWGRRGREAWNVSNDLTCAEAEPFLPRGSLCFLAHRPLASSTELNKPKAIACN